MIRLFVLVMGQEMVWVLVLDDELVDVVVVGEGLGWVEQAEDVDHLCQ